MSALVSIVSRRALRSLMSCQTQPEGIRSWITKGSFVIDPSSTSDKLLLKNLAIGEFSKYQAFDYQRFALSSAETIAFCKPEKFRPKALSWPLLKIYYAAFFGAHALLRSGGRSIFRLEKPQALRLTDLGKFFCGPEFVFPAGILRLKLLQNADLSIDAEITRIDEGGGVHASFWRQFNTYLEEIIEDANSVGEPEVNEIVAKIEEIRSVLTLKGSVESSWLSQIRNQINYQHQYGVWFPFGVSAQEAAQIGALTLKTLLSTRLDYDQRKETVQAFCAGCVFIAAWSATVANTLVQGTAGSPGAFPQAWGRLLQDVPQLTDLKA